jgi:hypothetical protein
MRSLKMRASTSAGPDAGNGTTIVIGRVGKACADAFRVTCKMSAAAAPDRKRRREILSVLWDECARTSQSVMRVETDRSANEAQLITNVWS